MKRRTISFLALATVVLVLMWLAASFRKYKNESNDIEQRHHASSSAGTVAIVGVFSGLDSVHFARRRAQRLTWFPSSSGKHGKHDFGNGRLMMEQSFIFASVARDLA